MKKPFECTAGAAMAVALVLAPSTASANPGGYTTLQSPGIECRSADPNNADPYGIYAYYSALVNGTSDQNSVWCPLGGYAISNGFVQDPWPGGWVSVEVSQGWANTSGGNSSCYVAITAPTSGYTRAPNGITHNSWGTDTIYWTQFDTSNNNGAEVQCTIPPGAWVYNYRERQYAYFDWASW